jgi:hypothetical protein
MPDPEAAGREVGPILHASAGFRHGQEAKNRSHMHRRDVLAEGPLSVAGRRLLLDRDRVEQPRLLDLEHASWPSERSALSSMPTSRPTSIVTRSFASRPISVIRR